MGFFFQFKEVVGVMDANEIVYDGEGWDQLCLKLEAVFLCCQKDLETPFKESEYALYVISK